MKKEENIHEEDFGGKDNGFKVPEKYFEELPFKINARKEVVKTKVTYWLWTSSVAAVFSIVFVLLLFDRGEEKVDYYSESIENEVYQNEYLEEEISEEDLIDFILNDGQELN